MPPSLRAAARAALSRLRGPAPAPRFDARHDGAAAALDAEVESAFQLIGAAAVGTWEVLLTDLGRGLGPHPEARRHLDRVSDALVPTQEALQATGRKSREAVKEGLGSALSSGELRELTAPLASRLAGMGPAVEAGWTKTVAYLEPVCASLGDPGLEEALQSIGPRLRRLLDAEAAAFAATPFTLDEGLKGALLAATGRYQRGVVRAIETTLYEARTALLAAAARR